MRNCTTCAAYLGAGQCRENLESECAAGGGYEAHRPSIPEGYRYKRCDVYDAQKFVALFKSKKARVFAIEYVSENQKSQYNTDDLIAVSHMMDDRYISNEASGKRGHNIPNGYTTKMYPGGGI